jgi:D-alanyl-lipoteichoic acid acyltransferase DltB (MBOAT superfamily)
MLDPVNTFFLLTILFLVIFMLTRKMPICNNVVLLASGIIFYAWGNIFRAVLLLGLLVLDHLVVKTFFKNAKWKTFSLIVAISINVSTWLFFRVINKGPFGADGFAIPLGMSFYMLRKISFLLAAYQKRFVCDSSLIDYALYISFFPQIMSGPIEKPEEFLAQLKQVRPPIKGQIISNVQLLIFGLLKKIVIADNLRVIVDRIFLLDSPPLLLVYVGTMAFALQLFCDFSGYVDISRATAGFLGFQTSQNFQQPFFSITPQDFWNRWHITFTQWLQTTIFFPLRRILAERRAERRWVIDILPVLVTMLLSGFWHGSGLHFLVWGLYHALLLLAYRYLGLDKWAKNSAWMGKVFLWVVTSQFLLLGWLIFRSTDMLWLYDLVGKQSPQLGLEQWVVAASIFFQMLVFGLPLAIHYLINTSRKIALIGNPIFYAASMVLLLVFGFSGFQEFIYFAF